MLKQRMHYDAGREALTGDRKLSMCSSCRQSPTCGSSLLERSGKKTAELPGSLVAGGQDGQAYTVGLPGLNFVLHCLAVFPGLSVLMLAGALLGGQMLPAWHEPAAAIGALAGLTVGAVLLRLYDSGLGRRSLLDRLVVVPSGLVSEDDS
jgi:positive regulator of sigma E activity